MRAHVGGHQLKGAFFVESEDDLKLAQLSFEVQAVAGFGFDGGAAVFEAGKRPLARLGQQFIQAGCAGGLNGAGNTAASRHDLHVGFAFQAHFKLSGAVARPDEMGVGVHKTGQKSAATGIQLFSRGIAFEQFG